ncbi:hypothetical protein FORC065_2197 [Yersinia enterocolitica]|nr:hypothetical protein FORC065_2197 [Yersinia enterocolitica]
MGITRRDFLNGVAIAVTAGMTPFEALKASPQTAAQTLYYPPSLTGMRGNHRGSYEAAHILGREGKKVDPSSRRKPFSLPVSRLDASLSQTQTPTGARTLIRR